MQQFPTVEVNFEGWAYNPKQDWVNFFPKNPSTTFSPKKSFESILRLYASGTPCKKSEK